MGLTPGKAWLGLQPRSAAPGAPENYITAPLSLPSPPVGSERSRGAALDGASPPCLDPCCARGSDLSPPSRGCPRRSLEMSRVIAHGWGAFRRGALPGSVPLGGPPWAAPLSPRVPFSPPGEAGKVFRPRSTLRRPTVSPRRRVKFGHSPLRSILSPAVEPGRPGRERRSERAHPPGVSALRSSSGQPHRAAGSSCSSPPLGWPASPPCDRLPASSSTTTVRAWLLAGGSFRGEPPPPGCQSSRPPSHPLGLRLRRASAAPRFCLLSPQQQQEWLGWAWVGLGWARSPPRL